MRSQVATFVALALSTFLHVAVVASVGRAAPSAAASEEVEQRAPDVWAGDTLELASLLAPMDDTASTEGAPPEPGAATAPEPVPTAPAEPAPPVEPPAAGTATPAPPALARAPAAPPLRSSGRVDRAAPAPRAHPSLPSASRSPSTPSALGALPGAGDALPRAAGASGAAGRRGVRHLATAFTRAVPIANAGDPVWRGLPLGNAGQAKVKIVVDEEGHIAHAEVLEERAVPGYLRKLVDSTLVMLRAGRYALAHAAGISAGSQVLEIAVVISRVDGGVAAQDVSAGPFGLGHEPPAEGRPGRAFFTLRTGEHVEVTVRVLRGI